MRRRYVHRPGHPNEAERFWSKVAKGDGCWERPIHSLNSERWTPSPFASAGLRAQGRLPWQESSKSLSRRYPTSLAGRHGGVLRMSRRRFVYRKNEETGAIESVEVAQDYQSAPERSGSNFLVDRYMEGTRSPVDGSDIGSRAKRREHMKAHGLVDADDYKGQWAQQAKERADFLSTGRTPGVDWAKRLAETHEKLSRRR